MALCIADALRESARRFPESLPARLQEAAELAAHRQGEFFASATELCLAVELYLKALLIGTGKQVPKTHRLPDLFEGLDTEERERADTLFRSLCKKAPVGKVTGYIVRVRVKDDAAAEPPDDDGGVRVRPSPADRGEGLRELLHRTGSAFSTWRYMYEEGELGQAHEFDYEHGLLQLACEALRRTAYPRFSTTLTASVKVYLDSGELALDDEALERFVER